MHPRALPVVLGWHHHQTRPIDTSIAITFSFVSSPSEEKTMEDPFVITFNMNTREPFGPG